MSRVAIIKLTYLYYKSDSMYASIKTRLARQSPEASAKVYLPEDSCKMVGDLVDLVHSVGQPRLRYRATLYHVYHHALHNRLRQAKDLMMKTHMSQLVHHMNNIDNQIMYNRALTQTGLAAFRLGKIQEAHDLLVDIQNNQKHKELLA